MKVKHDKLAIYSSLLAVFTNAIILQTVETRVEWQDISLEMQFQLKDCCGGQLCSMFSQNV